MVAAPLAKSLFHGAINESGATINEQNRRTCAELEQQGVAFAQAGRANSVAELHRLSWQEITDPLPGVSGAAPRWGPALSIPPKCRR